MSRMTKYITNTRLAQQLNMEMGMSLVISYLAANRTAIADPEDLSSIFSARALNSTPMSEIFAKCVVGRHMDIFATIASPSAAVVGNIPEILTMPSMVIDLAQTPKGEQLSAYRECYRKVVMNITNLVKVNRSTGMLETSALHELHSMYVKALLVRSYFDSDRHKWLSPIMQQFIVKTFSLFIGNVVSRQVNAFAEQNTVASIFALYMTQMLSGSDDDISCPPAYLNYNFLGNRSDLMYIAERCQEIAKDGLDIDTCCLALSEFGSARFKNYDRGMFIRHCSCLGVSNDTVSTYMAFEYPPYWVWLVLLALSNAKMAMMNKMLQSYNMKTPGLKFAIDLMSYTSLLNH